MAIPDDHREPELIREANAFHTTSVYRDGDTLIKETGPWASSVHALLRHLENEGFPYSPRVVGSGFDELGRETLTFIEGSFIDPGSWSIEACHSIGVILRQLHQATNTFQHPSDALWRQWFGRTVGNAISFGHCDFASWNIVSNKGIPVALIDWEYAGPVDPLVELAQACWLNAKLHDDIVAEYEDLPPLEERARLLRAIVDGYGLAQQERSDFVTRIIEFVILATANEADEAGLRIDTTLRSIHQQVPWAMAWRSRSASWMLKNRQVLQDALS